MQNNAEKFWRSLMGQKPRKVQFRTGFNQFILSLTYSSFTILSGGKFQIRFFGTLTDKVKGN